MNAAIYNRVRAAIEAHGGSDAMAGAVCDVVGDEIAAATQDALSGYREEDPPPGRLGHTECEASLRWCPFAREIVELSKKATAVGNRYTDQNGSDYANPAGARCIGSHCMAWHWSDPLRGHCGIAGPVTFQPIGEPRRLANRTPLERPTPSEQVDLLE
jgi:hypothetical protein